MNTKKPLSLKDQVTSMMQIGLVAIAAVVATWGVANPMDASAVDGNEPQNAPTFASHHAQATAVCGGPAVKSGPTVVARDVIVVKNDGSTVKMDTTEAWDRNSDKNEANNIWAVAVCKADVA